MNDRAEHCVCSWPGGKCVPGTELLFTSLLPDTRYVSRNGVRFLLAVVFAWCGTRVEAYLFGRGSCATHRFFLLASYGTDGTAVLS